MKSLYLQTENTQKVNFNFIKKIDKKIIDPCQ